MPQNMLIILKMLRDLKNRLQSTWLSERGDEWSFKVELVQKVFECLEEVSQGKIKSGIPYERISLFLIEHAETVSCEELNQAVLKIIFS